MCSFMGAFVVKGVAILSTLFDTFRHFSTLFDTFFYIFLTRFDTFWHFFDTFWHFFEIFWHFVDIFWHYLTLFCINSCRKCSKLVRFVWNQPIINRYKRVKTGQNWLDMVRMRQKQQKNESRWITNHVINQYPLYLNRNWSKQVKITFMNRKCGLIIWCETLQLNNLSTALCAKKVYCMPTLKLQQQY